MSLIEDTNPRQLKQLLNQIHESDMALPDFQRNFVWRPQETQELLVSIAKNYPAGSLLRIRNTLNLFPFRAFQEAKELPANSHPTFLVLDGQQRLTSLYQALHGKGDVRYYLSIRKLIEGEDIADSLFAHEVVTKKAREYEKSDVQARELVLPLGVLTHEIARGYGNWANSVERQAPTLEERNKLGDQLRRIGDTWITSLESYQFPVVTLSGETPAEAVCKIFETVNRSGIQLSPFELLSARYFAQGVNVRALWSKAKQDYPVLIDFKIDPYSALQVISLATRGQPSCKVNDILALDASMVRDNWDRAIRGLASALDIIQSDCGVIQAKWLPSSAMLLPLAAVLAQPTAQATPQAGANRHKLIQWFWCAVFSQVYESSSDTQAARDTAQIRKWLEGGERPKCVQTFRFDPRLLRSITSRRSSLYRGIISLIVSRRPRDFHTAAPLTGSLFIEKRIDDHHIFPRAFLRRQKISERLHDCVLNRTLIDHDTNNTIADRAPSAYLNEMQQALGEEKFALLMQSHLLPDGSRSPLLVDNFSEFLSRRLDAIWAAIQHVTGAQAPANLVAEETNIDTSA